MTAQLCRALAGRSPVRHLEVVGGMTRYGASWHPRHAGDEEASAGHNVTTTTGLTPATRRMSSGSLDRTVM